MENVNALNPSGQTVTPPEEIIVDENQLKMEIPLTEEEQKIQQAKEDYDKSALEHAQKIVEGIKAGYEEAKGLAKDLSAKTIGTWITEKDLAKLLRSDMSHVKKLLMHLDRFGMLDMKIVGPAVLVKTSRRPEEQLKKLLRDKGQLLEKMAQLEGLLAIVHGEIPKDEVKEEEVIDDTPTTC